MPKNKNNNSEILLRLKRLISYSYFHSILSYRILLWGSAADINSIFILQKRAARSIYNRTAQESLRDVFKDAGINTVASQLVYYLLYSVCLTAYRVNCDRHTIGMRNKLKHLTPIFHLQKVNINLLWGLSMHVYNKIPRFIVSLPLQ